jgi:hypothetical protein
MRLLLFHQIRHQQKNIQQFPNKFDKDTLILQGALSIRKK